MKQGLKKSHTRYQRGASVVEFAIVAAIALSLLVGIVELGLAYFINLTMQHAVREGARYAITGQASLDPNASNQQRYLAIIQEIKNSSLGYFDPVVKSIVVTVNNGTPTGYDTTSAYAAGMFGGPGDIIVLRLDCSWPVMTPYLKLAFDGGEYAFSVAATMRNESY